MIRQPSFAVPAAILFLMLWISPWPGGVFPAGGPFEAHADNTAGSAPPDIFQIITAPGGRLFALTSDPGGLFFSADGGKRWELAGGLPEARLYSVADDLQGNFFLATSQGIFRSEDAGKSWQKISELNAAFLAFSPETDACLIKLWGQGLFWVRPDEFSNASRGDLIRVSGLPNAPVQSLMFGPGGMAFAGFFGKGVFSSQDSGRTFQDMNRGLDNRDVLALGMSGRGILFAGTYGGGLFRWSDRTSAWTRAKDGLVAGIVQCLAAGSAGDMLAGTRGEGVLISRDDGDTWSPLAQAAPAANVHALASGKDGTIWAGIYGSGLFMSRDGGRNWSPRAFAYLAHVLQLSADPEDGAWYAGIKGLGLLRSIDRGRTWTQVVLPFPYDDKMSLMFHDGRLFAGRPDAGPFVSDDGGIRWEKAVRGLPDDGVHSLKSDGGSHAFSLSGDGKGIYRLSAGDVWHLVIADDEYGDNYSAWDLVFLPGGEAVAYGYNDVLVSYGGLSSWRRNRFGQAFKDLWIDARGKIWTRRMMTTFALSDDGREWDARDDLPGERYTDFAVLPPDRLVAVAQDGGLAVLQGSGAAPAPVGNHLRDKRVLAVAVDRDRTILAGTDRGLWASRDLGRSWEEVDLLP